MVKTRKPVSNRSSGNLANYGAGTESYQRRNEILPSADTMRQELLEVLGYNKTHPDVDNVIEFRQPNSQESVIKNITDAVLKEDYPTAQAILFRENLNMTPQLEEIALRLNRLVQVSNRQGTTDSLEFAQAKDVLKGPELQEDLARFSQHGSKQQAELVLGNVAESLSGTREMGVQELLQAREMVQAALKREFKSNYELPLPPHQLAGQNEGARFVNRDQNPKLAEYLRLFDALTIELMRQRELATGHEQELTLEREVAVNLFKGVEQTPGVNIDAETKAVLIKKIEVMDLNQLKYFGYKVELLRRTVEAKALKPGQAQEEIQTWLKKDFSSTELHEEIADLKSRNELIRAKQLEILRGEISNQPIRQPVTRPVSFGELHKAS